jgi:hypothetical protein
MLIQGTCDYCNKKTEVAMLRDWNNEEIVRYYCRDHYDMVRREQEKEKYEFIKYYRDPNFRKWLTGKSLELYNRLTKK